MFIWCMVSLRKATQLAKYARNDSNDPRDQVDPNDIGNMYNFWGYFIGLLWYCWLLISIPKFEPDQVRGEVKVTRTKFILHRIVSGLSFLWFLLLVFLSSNNNNMDRVVVISVNASLMLVVSILSLFSRPQRNVIKSNIRHGYTRLYMALSLHLFLVFLAYTFIFVERWVTIQQSEGDSVCSADCEYFLNYCVSLLPLGYFAFYGFKWFSPRDILDAHPRDLLACKMNHLDVDEGHRRTEDQESMIPTRK